jgi:mannose-1-phosphate guanylyltransferase
MHHAVIMAGGSGTRFWPASRAAHPKQLLSLGGGGSLLQETVRRLDTLIPDEQVWIVTSGAHSESLRSQVPQLPPANLLVEPCGRNTAPCVGLAALHIRRREPEAILVCMPADHIIQDTRAWQRLIGVALETAAERGRTVTFGIPPTRPETGFGYVKFDAEQDPAGRHRVQRFTEKPDRERAEAFLAEGNWYWNSGIVAWRADTFLDLCRRHLPELMDVLDELDASLGTPAYPETLERLYPRMPSVSFDLGILEKAEGLVGLPAAMGWSDVGSWSALPEVLAADASGNVSLGEFLALDAQGCIAYAPGKLVAAVGVADLVVVDTPDAILICPKDRAQDVKHVVERLIREGRSRYL